MIAPSLEQQLTVLQHRLDEAFERIGELEKEVAANRRSAGTSTPPTVDSPQMAFALRLCGELFPGSNTEVESECNDDEPSIRWYTLVLRWKASPTDALERESQWHTRFDQEYPADSQFFRLFVALE